MFTNFKELFKTAVGYDPFPYQEELIRSEKIPLIIEVPTGAGKTAAAVLSWVWRRFFAPEAVRQNTPTRLIYCLPMRVLVEQTVNCIKDWLQKLGIEDKVHLAMLMGGDVDTSWVTSPEKEAVIVGTQDMLLSRALNRGYSSSIYRWAMEFGIINNDSLWVIDEVQLMGSGLRTTSQLQAFREMMGTTGSSATVWMSATFNKNWLETVDYKIDPDNCHMIKLSPDDKNNSEIHKRIFASKILAPAESSMPKDPPAAKTLAAEILNHHVPQTRTIVILNTVRRAKELYQAFKKMKESGGVDIILLHSQFRPGDREKALKEALKDPSQEGTIVISTQVIEAGVDVSSKTMFTEIAPIPSLVQRFGRCNRRGEYEEAKVFWIDGFDADKAYAKSASPYNPEDLVKAKEVLLKLDNVRPESLKSLGMDVDIESGLVLRKKDILELFDTTPDLTGFQVDISRFIRETDDFNVNVFWRALGDSNNPNSPEQPLPQREEICSAPVKDAADLISKNAKDKPLFWKWDYIEGEWANVTDKSEIIPGAVFLMNSDDGRYSVETGWDPKEKSKVEPVETAAPAENKFTGKIYNADSEAEQQWMTIAEHTDMVVSELNDILAEINIPQDVKDSLLTAARWHDAGKAHPVFQSTMRKGNGSDAPSHLLAKCPHKNLRHDRKGFRHELASALLALQHGKDDLSAYLAAAHHGKVRLLIRALPDEKPDPNYPERRFARGIFDGEEIPAGSYQEIDLGGGEKIPKTKIDLTYMDLGETNGKPSWAYRMTKLRDLHGPFKLAYFENLIRSADIRASSK